MPEPIQDPSSIPGIELVERIGDGGSAVVYRALRKGVPCALKVGKRSRGFDARWFRREAAALARTPHPGVPQVFEVGTVDERPYIAMELVEGETLSARLKRSPLATDQILALVTDLCQILSDVHRRGLVHRDLTPRNIVLSDGRTRVVDFGLATFDHRPSNVAGTERYAAPEQLRVPTLVDGRTDLYALGRVIEKCIEVVPPQAPTVEGWAVLVDGLVATDPSERYATADLALEDVQRLSRGEPPIGPTGFPEIPADVCQLVGRDRELEQLLTTWSRPPEVSPTAIRIVGDAGAGKSRLIHELVRRARSQQITTVFIDANDLDVRPHAFESVLLDRIVTSNGLPDHPNRVSAVRTKLGADVASFAATVSPQLKTLLGQSHAPSPPEEAEAVIEVLADAVGGLLRSMPRALVAIDHAERLSPSARALLRSVGYRVRDRPVLIACATRDSGLFHWRDLGESIRLAELTGDQAVELVGAVLGSPSDRAGAEWARSLAGASPLAVIELVGAMMEGGALSPFDGTWRFVRSIAESMALPRGTRALVSAKLAELPAAGRETLAVAAAIGSEFDPDLVAGCLRLTLSDVHFAVSHAQRAGLILPSENGQYRFAHDCIREELLRGAAREAPCHSWAGRRTPRTTRTQRISFSAPLRAGG